VPPRGYWAKVGAGKKVRKAVLPKDAKLTATYIWCETKREKTPADGADVAWLKGREAFEAVLAHAVRLVVKPSRWHEAIAPLRGRLEAEAKKIEAARKTQERYEK